MPLCIHRIELVSLEVLDHPSMTGPGDWQIEGTIKEVVNAGMGASRRLGDERLHFEAKKNETITLNWVAEESLQPGATEIRVTVKARDVAGLIPVDLGQTEIVVPLPCHHQLYLALTSSIERYSATFDIKVFGWIGPFGPVTTMLQSEGSSTHNTVHTEMLTRAVQICPVIPVPYSSGMPPFPRGVYAENASPQNYLGIGETETTLNALVNPAVIPVLDPLDPDFGTRAARIRITEHRPSHLDLSKLIWISNSDALAFWAGGQKNMVVGGEEVIAYGFPGEGDREVSLEIRYDEPGRPLLATYRAWVGKPMYIWARANIIKCSRNKIGTVTIKSPTVTPAQIKEQLAFNNVLLWQLGLQIVMDDDTTAYDGAAFKERGIFEFTANDNHTFNIPDDDNIIATLPNSRKGVFNFAYIHGMEGDPDLLGMATDRLISPESTTVDSAVTPSTSWVRPTGVSPDDPAQTISMKTMGPTKKRTDPPKYKGDGNTSSLSACIMTQLSCDVKGDNTMAHELCHVLGLHHRGNGGFPAFASVDGVNHLAGPRKGRGHPWTENVMSYGSKSDAQDLDFIQAQVVRKHPLLRDAPPPPPKPPKKEPKPVPAAWLPTREDKILLQEYLCGKRPGLIHSGYDLGPHGPDMDGVDGVIGAKTKQAVKDFQKDHGGLSADGIYGPKTRAAFDQELNPPEAP
jgi:hypothetical protein